MPSTLSLLETLKWDLPHISFSRSDTFRWSPDDTTVYYANTSDATPLLHEVAHATLGHTRYHYDIELLKMEREAWDQAIKLAREYTIEIDGEYIESTLDTYRDWLHNRSLCPTCEATGIQIGTSRYSCLACNEIWRVNEARMCALRRYKLSSHNQTKK